MCAGKSVAADTNQYKKLYIKKKLFYEGKKIIQTPYPPIHSPIHRILINITALLRVQRSLYHTMTLTWT
jgi:hypothetical protein